MNVLLILLLLVYAVQVAFGVTGLLMDVHKTKKDFTKLLNPLYIFITLLNNYDNLPEDEEK